MGGLKEIVIVNRTMVNMRSIFPGCTEPEVNMYTKVWTMLATGLQHKRHRIGRLLARLEEETHG